MEIEAPIIEPKVETVDNRCEPTSEEISRIVGFNIDNGVSTSQEEPANATPDPEQSEQPVEEPTPDPGPEGDTDPASGGSEEPDNGEEAANDFWGVPNANGEYVLTQDKLDQLRECMEAMNAEQRQIYNEALATKQAYEQQYAAAVQNLQRLASDYIARHGAQPLPKQTETPAPQPPTPAESAALERTKAAMLEQAKIVFGDPKVAENFVNSQSALMEALVAEKSGKDSGQAEALKPYLERLEQTAYREDLNDTFIDWSHKIQQNLAPFGIDPKAAEILTEKYIEAANATHIRKFGKPLPIEDLNNRLMADQARLVVGALVSQINSRNNGEAQDPPKTVRPNNPLRQIPKRTVQPQTIPSTVAAQRSVATGDALRAMNDAGITGVGGSASGGDNTKVQYLSDLKKAVGVNFAL